jgi:hypothetical protein
MARYPVPVSLAERVTDQPPQQGRVPWSAEQRFRRFRWPLGLAVLAAFGALSMGLAFVLRSEFTYQSACDTEGPRVAAAIETFLRDNSGGVRLGPAEPTICDSVPGVVVGLAPQSRDPDWAALSAALLAAGCNPAAQLGVGYESRSCTRPSGEDITVEVINRDGSVGVHGSSDLDGQGPLPARGTQ